MALDKRVKAVVASTMYDMTRVMSKGYNDSVTLEQRTQGLEQLGAQRWVDAENGAPAYQPPYNELKGGEAQFMVDYHDYYSTSRGCHPRAFNSGNSWTVTTPLSFMNMPILAYHTLDVTKQDENDRIVQLAKEKFGRVDVIFLNAGLMPNSPLSALKTEDWHQMIDVNVKGVLNGVAAVLPEFLAQKSGHVITTSSGAGLKAYPGGAVYGGTKWFVRDFMEVLRMESAMEGNNIRTATIYPAAVNTELLATISDKQALDQMQDIYDKYGISPDRIANVVAFAINQPDDTTINEFTVGPANQPW